MIRTKQWLRRHWVKKRIKQQATGFSIIKETIDTFKNEQFCLRIWFPAAMIKK